MRTSENLEDFKGWYTYDFSCRGGVAIVWREFDANSIAVVVFDDLVALTFLARMINL